MLAELALSEVLQRQRRNDGGLDLRATRLFDRVLRDPQPNRIKKLFDKRLKPLPHLEDVAKGRHLSSRRYGGMQVVAVDAIHGTLNRSTDFDYDFHPLQQSDAGRWSQIATAMMHGVELPPIEVIQVDGNYFVKDGHHRISVARALGYRYLDAVVEIWAEA
jgi:hypothetical protein